MIDHNWHRNRTAVLATMHCKEQVIAPLFATELSIAITVPPQFDTDRFGTFTREVKRPGTQLEAARLKAKAALATTGATLAIASEGSFGPHPQCPWAASNREIVLLIDTQHHFEVYADHLSLTTNYAHADVSSLGEAIAFAKQVKFPSHGLVIMDSTTDPASKPFDKGITEWEHLKRQVQSRLQDSSSGLIRLETDMRAMVNPMRMDVIQQTTQLLIQKLKRTCPDCNCPGFDVVESIPGLPCAWCHRPTVLILEEIYRCQHCSLQQVISKPQGQDFADPGHCPTCNP